MTITVTTEEAERLAKACSKWGMDNSATTLRSLAAERDALKAERDMLKRDNEIMVGMINDMGTIFIKARAALGEKE